MRFLRSALLAAATVLAPPAIAEEPESSKDTCYKLDTKVDWSRNNGAPVTTLTTTGEVNFGCNEKLVLEVGRKIKFDNGNTNFAFLVGDLPPEDGLDLGGNFTLLAEAFAGVVQSEGDRPIFEGGAAVPLRLDWNQNIYTEIKPGFLYIKPPGEEGRPAATLSGVFGATNGHNNIEIEAGMIRFYQNNDTLGVFNMESEFALGRLAEGVKAYLAMDANAAKRFTGNGGFSYKIKPALGVKLKGIFNFGGWAPKLKAEIGPTLSGNQNRHDVGVLGRLVWAFDFD